ncbi:haloacid dehalogenase-like hydrolase [Candidatus Woesearchaeota archaeon]|nr:haloacid dehalogenase-like hydrolase [Candidatus Woesearchaeota archaeon]
MYEEWFQKNCGILEGIPVELVCKQIFPPPYTPGLREFCAYLHKEKVKRGIVSSGVDLVASRIKKDMGLDFVIANELRVINGKFSGDGIEKVPLWKK